MKKTETQRVNEWSKANTKGYYFKLNIEKDADLISWQKSMKLPTLLAMSRLKPRKRPALNRELLF